MAGSVGGLHIEGNTFPVQQYYLEDLVEARLRAAVAAQQQKLARRNGRRIGASWDDSPPVSGSLDIEDGQASPQSETNDEGTQGAAAGRMSGALQQDARMQLPFVTPKLPDDSEVASLAAAAARLTVVPEYASVAVGRYQPDKDNTLHGRQRAAVLDYEVRVVLLRGLLHWLAQRAPEAVCCLSSSSSTDSTDTVSKSKGRHDRQQALVALMVQQGVTQFCRRSTRAATAAHRPGAPSPMSTMSLATRRVCRVLCRSTSRHCGMRATAGPQSQT